MAEENVVGKILRCGCKEPLTYLVLATFEDKKVIHCLDIDKTYIDSDQLVKCDNGKKFREISPLELTPNQAKVLALYERKYRDVVKTGKLAIDLMLEFNKSLEGRLFILPKDDKPYIFLGTGINTFDAHNLEETGLAGVRNFTFNEIVSNRKNTREISPKELTSNQAQVLDNVYQIYYSLKGNPYKDLKKSGEK